MPPFLPAFFRFRLEFMRVVSKNFPCFRGGGAEQKKKGMGWAMDQRSLVKCKNCNTSRLTTIAARSDTRGQNRSSVTFQYTPRPRVIRKAYPQSSLTTWRPEGYANATP
jgi:hypothetical protein